ncbi:hypothetical protein QN277_016883 [Acacia crassicarpa]|uniref:Band 7 domain-containing protein n=1 Tax=Acacia crassicarpa TaxID=499986 RepID=A0AAE1MXQ2_9FABA|nr:hypothetical protein QN277_016883 [Acacia crassicarpa]
MDPNQQRARPRTQTSSFMLRFFLPFIAIMSAMIVYRLQKEYVHEALQNHELDYNKTLILDKIHHHINQEYVRETLLNHKLDYNKTLILDKIHRHINQVEYRLHKEYVGGTLLNHELDYNKTLIVDKIHHHINQVVYRLHKEYVHETLLNHELDYNKSLIHDKVHHHINQVCASHSLQQVYIIDFLKISEEIKEALQADCTLYAPGIEIIGVHVTKLAIPDSIRRYFKQLEEEPIEVLVAVERQKVVEKEAETSKKMTISKAKKNANVNKILASKKVTISEAKKNANVMSKILMEQTLLGKEDFGKQQEIENQMYLQRERDRAYVNFRATKEAEANSKLKLALKFIEAFVEIAKRSSGMTSFSPGYFNAAALSSTCFSSYM